MKEVLLGGKLACVVRHGGVLSVAGFGCIPNVGDFGHWNVKEIIPCQVKDDRYFSLRDGKEVPLEGSSLLWPLLIGTVLHYRDGKQFLLTRRCLDGETVMLDVTGREVPPSTTHLTVKS